MKDEKIRILVKEPYKEPEIVEVVDELENLQALVGGYIECVGHPTVKEVDIVCDEEGMLAGKAGNFYLPEYQDCIKGTCFMVSYDDEGNFVSLTDKQIKECQKYINLYKLEEGEDLYNDYYDIVERIDGIFKKQQQEEEYC